MNSYIKSIGIVAVVAWLAVAGSIHAATLTYNFDDGTDQGWLNLETSPLNPPIAYEASSRSDASAPAQSGSFRVIPKIIGAFSPTEDSDHDTLVFSSPVFTLGPAGSIDLYLHIGAGFAATPGPDFASLPATSSTTGFEGVGLRRVSDGAYVMSVRKSAGGWELLQFSNASLTANSLIGIPLALDLIDQFHGGGGWVALDDVVINDVVPEPSAILLMSVSGLLLWWRRRGGS